MGNEALEVSADGLAMTTVLARAAKRSDAAPRRRRRLYRFALFAGFGALVAGCVYDSDDRCNAGMVLLGPFCTCPEGSVLTGQECVPCGENEVAGGTACVCAEGFSRASEDSPCREGPAGLGAACGAGATCPDPAYGLCFTPSGSAGYCTSECATSEDCDAGYACNTSATAPYCQRPPSGAGVACAAAADCDGKDASFCESFMLHECVVPGCSPEAQDCFPGMRCCDFRSFGAPTTFCLPAGAC
jgi:hypothetical protein